MATSDTLIKRIRGKSLRIKGVDLPAFSISRENQKLIFEFDQLLQAKGKKEHTRRHYLWISANLCHRIKRPIKSMIQKDLIKFVSWIEHNKNYSQATKSTYKSCLRSFFKWVYGIPEKKKVYPEVVDFIETGGHHKRDLSKGDLLTWKDIESMLKVADSGRDKAIIMTLYCGGLRRGEIISCRIKDLQFYPEGYAVLRVPTNSVARTGVAKTGSYQATLTDSVPFLKAYLNDHPDKDNPNAPLFYAISRARWGKPLEADGVYILVKRLSKRAGLKKNVFTHLFRHSHGTNRAEDGFTAEEINLMHGRRQGSPESQTYIHLDGRDIRKKVLIKKGIVKEPTGGTTNGIQNIPCWNCGNDNPSKNVICYSCDMPLFLKEHEKPRFERVAKALFVYDTFDRAVKKNPKVVDYFKKIEEVLRK
ncbi:tyrosine-type recombinase/integrase [Candidatus Aenigmatarchaeota archaeon]